MKAPHPTTCRRGKEEDDEPGEVEAAADEPRRRELGRQRRGLGKERVGADDAEQEADAVDEGVEYLLGDEVARDLVSASGRLGGWPTGGRRSAAPAYQPNP